MESRQEHVICPHCGAENPKSLIVTTCSRCLQPLSGGQPAAILPTPSPPPAAPMPDRARRAPILPPRPQVHPPHPTAPRPAAQELPPLPEASKAPPSEPQLPHLLPRYQAEQPAASRPASRRPAVQRLGNVVFVLMLGAVIFMVAQPDVRLRVNDGEVVGWVSVTRSRDSEGHVRYRASVEPLVYPPTAPRRFRSFSSGAGARLHAACQARGLDPIGRRFPDFPWATSQPGGPAFGQGSTRVPAFMTGQRQVLCRLRYAGLGRHVVYEFEEFRPEDETRLRQELGGGRFPGGSMHTPAPGFVPRR